MVGPTYPFSLYNRRVGKCERTDGCGGARAGARSRIHRGMLKGITARTRCIPGDAARVEVEGKGGKHLLSPSLKCFRVAGTKTRLFIRRGARRRRARRPRPISIASQFIDRMRSSNFSRC